MTLFVKYEDLDERIAEVRYHRVEGTTATVCTVILHSGFVVIGQSACINPEVFDEMRMTRRKRSLKWHKQKKGSW